MGETQTVTESASHPDLDDRLESLPENIRDKEIRISKLDQGVADLEARQQAYYTSIYAAVSQEKDDDKPKFSNEKARDAETRKRLKESPDYVKVADDLMKKRAELNEAKIDLRFLQNRFSATKHLVRLTVGFQGGSDE